MADTPTTSRGYLTPDIDKTSQRQAVKDYNISMGKIDIDITGIVNDLSTLGNVIGETTQYVTDLQNTVSETVSQTQFAAALEALETKTSALTGRLGPNAKMVTDWNDAVENGYYFGADAENGPWVAHWLIHVVAHASNHVTQTAHAFGVDTEANTYTYQRDCNSGSWSAWYRVYNSATEILSLIPSALPVGAEMPWQNDIPPSGWFIQDGSNFSAATYPLLNAHLGSATLPDVRGVVIRGKDRARGLDPNRVLGSYQGDAYKSHNHSGSSGSAGGHNHRTATGFSSGGPWGGVSQSGAFTQNGGYSSRVFYTSSVGNHSHSVSIGSSGSNETRMKNIAKNWIIKHD